MNAAIQTNKKFLKIHQVQNINMSLNYRENTYSVNMAFPSLLTRIEQRERERKNNIFVFLWLL